MPNDPHSLANHPITVEPAGERVVVRVGDTVVADTRSALVLKEADYPPAFYLPADDVNAALLEQSDTTTYCPYKGDATYRSVRLDADTVVEDAAWVYEHPNVAVAEVLDHLSFYPGKVSISVED